MNDYRPWRLRSHSLDWQQFGKAEGLAQRICARLSHWNAVRIRSARQTSPQVNQSLRGFPVGPVIFPPGIWFHKPPSRSMPHPQRPTSLSQESLGRGLPPPEPPAGPPTSWGRVPETLLRQSRDTPAAPDRAMTKRQAGRVGDLLKVAYPFTEGRCPHGGIYWSPRSIRGRSRPANGQHGMAQFLPSRSEEPRLSETWFFSCLKVIDGYQTTKTCEEQTARPST